MDPLIWEKGDKLYIVAPVSPFNPAEAEVDEFAFAQQLKAMAPNEAIMWLKGQYVEADSANSNGQVWTSKELAIKSMTPMLMPVTVMHDPRTAVGTIAEAKLLTPEADSVPRARIDTSLAIWAHRFPEVAEEVQHNYEAGSLMQSMECVSPDYACANCGRVFQKMPGGAERDNWCSHLAEASGFGARILGNVVFTGTGLIFGTRGAQGAFDKAHLDVFQEEVAEALDKSHHDTKNRKQTNKPQRRKNFMEIEDRRYDELVAAESAAKRVPDLEADLAKVREEAAQAVKDAEAAEVAKKAAEDAKAEAERKLTEAEESANAAKLSEDRFEKLGSKFLGKLTDSIKGRLTEQSKTMSDEDWDARLTELSELVAVRPEENNEGGTAPGKTPAAKGEEFSRAEIAAAQGGSGGDGGGGNEPSQVERGSVMRGLMPGRAKSAA